MKNKQQPKTQTQTLTTFRGMKEIFQAIKS